jgi:lipoprotein-anchoring transpeptidase ErfK/SrfK
MRGSKGFGMRLRVTLLILSGLTLGACNHVGLDLASDSAQTPRDKQLLASAKYAPASIPEQYKRQVVNYHRKELPGTVVVDTDNRYLYYVMPEGRALRYGVAVGEEALVFSGVARVARKAEWPRWIPTENIKRRLANIPNSMEGGPDNPMGARALYLYEGNRDTLFRIHGTNQPEYIGEAISSGCIRMTNEDVIDLAARVKIGSPVVVLAPTGAQPQVQPQAQPQIVAQATSTTF